MKHALRDVIMFRIGEFSKVAQVPASLLRYYDEMGLLTSVRCDRDTSYRYDSMEQLSQLNRSTYDTANSK